jgi:hypothetical protein
MVEVGKEGGAVTPTLLGRWQTRLAMLATWGILITFFFALTQGAEGFNETFYVLGYVALFGLAWDVAFIFIQRLRWDRDWPAVFQFAAGVVEGALLFVLIRTTGLPGIAEGSISLGLFVAHYGTVWLVTFIWVQGPMRAIFPRWRFTGGRLV